MAWTQEKIDDVMKKIGERSKTDKAFRDRALKDPKGVIKEIAGEEVPSIMKLTFVEDKEWDKVVILPEFAGDELDDSDLENVAGGRASECPNLNSCGGYRNRVRVL